jgi:hypothetical protein
MAIRQTADGHRRSVAWVYYAIITALLVVAGFSGVISALPCALATAAYSQYLFRGGRFVLWIW